MFSFMKKDAKVPYSSLSDDEKLSEDSTFLPKQSVRQRPVRRLWPWVLPWIMSSVFFAILTLRFYAASREPAYGSFERGWQTDFKPSRAYIERREMTFNGGPVFSPNWTYYVPNPDPVKYVGEPSPAIDDAWEELIGGRYFLVTKEEAKDALRFDYPDMDVQQLWNPIRGGYIQGVEMLHTLHCLNRLRQGLRPDYYTREARGHHKNLATHQAHCVEHIRQYIMCHGDMTPIPAKYNEGHERGYVITDVTHTCRNFQLLRGFVKERYSGSLAVKPECPHGTVEEDGKVYCHVPGRPDH